MGWRLANTGWYCAQRSALMESSVTVRDDGRVFKTLHAVVDVFVVAFGGWTAITHLAVLSGASLDTLLLLAPCGVGAFFLVFLRLPSSRSVGSSATGLVDCDPERAKAGRVCVRSQWLTVGLCVVAMVALTLGVSRSDLDDAFYAAVASNTFSFPREPLMAGDPMSGELDWPLLFPSYRYSTSELLVAALARVGNWHPLDVYYVIWPSLMAVLAGIATFVLGRALLPRHWIAAGVFTLLAVVVMGEMHRAPANFSFVRIYQGKAVFVSLLLPLLYAGTYRLLTGEGGPREAWVLACCVLAAIGMTNFGMLAAPMAVGTAMMSSAYAWRDIGWKRFAAAGVCALISLPYLLAVAASAQGSVLLQAPIETPWQVLRSVLGDHQIYLAGALLLSGPFLARDAATRWRLAVPIGALVLVYLNPFLSSWIATHVTTPPVYWRVTWTVPLLGGLGCGCALVWTRAAETRGMSRYWIWAAVVVLLLLIALPFHTLRSNNGVSFGSWAQWKIPPSDLEVAQAAIASHQGEGRLLAPDEVAGVVSRMPHHPVLVNVREHYIALLGASIPKEAVAQRQVLHSWLAGHVALRERAVVDSALNALCVTTVVISTQLAKDWGMGSVAKAQRVHSVNGFEIWRRPCDTGRS